MGKEEKSGKKGMERWGWKEGDRDRWFRILWSDVALVKILILNCFFFVFVFLTRRKEIRILTSK